MKESEKADLKLNIQKTKLMASSPITSWQIDGETMETMTGLIFLGSKITADGDCSHEIKILAPRRKAMKNIDMTLWAFVGKVMSLLFNKLSRLVITFLPKSSAF